MNRRSCINSLLNNTIRGTRNHRDRTVHEHIHQSQRPSHIWNIDFNNLGLKYPIKTSTPLLDIVEIGWTKPPQNLPELPFIVERSNNNALPVYTAYKGGRTKIVTILRKCSGDIDELKKEMEKVVGREVTIRPGKLTVDGNYHLRLKVWLSGLGF